MPQILSKHENVVYLVAGATHPHILRREGDKYRASLQALAREVGVASQVIFHDRFATPEEMAEFIGAADIYVTPYRHEAQVVSGTLAYALGAGKAIISTPYWHAIELLDEGRGALVPFQDPGAIAQKTIELLSTPALRHAMSDVLFDTGKYSLKPGAREKLAKVAGILLAYPGLNIEVGGYTDNVGGDQMNQTLSENRAASVRDYLVQQGVSSSAVTAKGFGNSLAVASNDNSAGRQQNRRVELLVSGEAIGNPVNPQTGSLR